MGIISKQSIKFLMNATTDKRGRLFLYNNSIFRGMWSKNKEYYSQLIDFIEKNKVLNQYIVNTKISNIEVESFKTVLEHEYLENITYPNEWSSDMFISAALKHIDINIELYKAGYNLEDAHLWNLTFKKGNPLYLDFASISKNTSKAKKIQLINEYLNFVLFPIVLIQFGHWDKAKKYLSASIPCLTIEDISGYQLGSLEKSPFLDIVNLIKAYAFKIKIKNIKKMAEKDFIKSLELIKSLILEKKCNNSQSVWQNYHADENKKKNIQEMHDKQKSIINLIDTLKPETVLDFGCATGYYSYLCAKKGCNVTASDIDDYIVNEVYNGAKVQDLLLNTIHYDLFRHDNKSKFKSEMVLSLAVIHHLVFSSKYNFEKIAEVFSELTDKYLITEFIDKNDIFVKERLTDEFSFYNIENFKNALSKYFVRCEEYPSSSENRTILLFYKE
ncbi:MAG: methyltransferase domain-containing protein [bacterium]